MDPEFYKNLFSVPRESLEHAVEGGLLIAAASSLYYLLFGKILGMSGMAGSLVKFPLSKFFIILGDQTRAKAIALTGIFLSSALVNYLFYNQIIPLNPYDSPSFTQTSSITRIVVSGLFVGLGTDLSNGCTSGHGLCGLPRFSLRSFVAVLVFLLTAIVVATSGVSQYIPELEQFKLPLIDQLSISPSYFLIGCGVVALTFLLLDSRNSFLAKFSLLVVGFIFGCGLMLSGMSQRARIYGFLELNKNWDPSLLFVLMTGVLFNLLTFSFIRLKMKKPLLGEKIENPKGQVTLKLVVGAFLFGVGWGIGGLCPGPFLLSIPHSLKLAFYWGLPFFISQKISQLIFQQKWQQQLKKD